MILIGGFKINNSNLTNLSCELLRFGLPWCNDWRFWVSISCRFALKRPLNGPGRLEMRFRSATLNSGILEKPWRIDLSTAKDVDYSFFMWFMVPPGLHNFFYLRIKILQNEPIKNWPGMWKCLKWTTILSKISRSRVMNNITGYGRLMCNVAVAKTKHCYSIKRHCNGGCALMEPREAGRRSRARPGTEFTRFNLSGGWSCPDFGSSFLAEVLRLFEKNMACLEFQCIRWYFDPWKDYLLGLLSFWTNQLLRCFLLWNHRPFDLANPKLWILQLV